MKVEKEVRTAGQDTDYGADAFNSAPPGRAPRAARVQASPRPRQERTPRPSPTAGHLAALRRRWYVVLLAAVLGGGSSAYVSLFVLSPVYQATATLMLAEDLDPAVEERRPSYDAYLADVAAVKTMKELALTQAVVQLVATDLRSTTQQTAAAVEVRVLPGTTLLELSGTSSDDEEASRIAATYAGTVSRLSAELAWAPGRRLVVASAAQERGTQIGPRVPFNIAVGAVAGAAIGAYLIVLLHHLRTQRRVEK